MSAQNTIVLDLEQPRFESMPLHPAHQQAGYSYVLHRRHEDWDNPNSRSSAAGMLICSDHSGTHIDALCHQAEGMLMCGDVAVDVTTQTPSGFTKLGIETLNPIYSNGIMLDVPAALGVDVLPDRYMVTAADLDACAQQQNVSIRPGDTVLVRTGNGRYWRDTAKYFNGPGIGTDAAEWLAACDPVAVGSDNVGWDLPGFVDPVLGDLPGHIILLVRKGIHIIESIYLEPLVETGSSEFEFVCSPLKIEGATASPVRPLALIRR